MPSYVSFLNPMESIYILKRDSTHDVLVISLMSYDNLHLCKQHYFGTIQSALVQTPLGGKYQVTDFSVVVSKKNLLFNILTCGNRINMEPRRHHKRVGMRHTSTLGNMNEAKFPTGTEFFQRRVSQFWLDQCRRLRKNSRRSV